MGLIVCTICHTTDRRTLVAARAAGWLLWTGGGKCPKCRALAAQSRAWRESRPCRGCGHSRGSHTGQRCELGCVCGGWTPDTDVDG